MIENIYWVRNFSQIIEESEDFGGYVVSGIDLLNFIYVLALMRYIN